MKKYILFVFLICLIFNICLPVKAVYVGPGHTEDDYYRVYDNDDNYIFSTAMGVTKGDRYISKSNIEYIVEKVKDKENKAIARKKEKIDLKVQLVTDIPEIAQDKDEPLVAFYHTHNAESYKPGPEMVEGRGDIHTVGRELAELLEQNSISTIHSENMHLPHDGAAYSRSRNTKLELIREQPDAILDIHRDAIPDEQEYISSVNGQKITQVRIVLGRKNPNREVNEQFARHLKAVSDENTPGLIRDIFMGQGEYNQALHPRSVLLELGTHTNTIDDVRKSLPLLAQNIASLLYADQGVIEDTGRAGWITLLWIIGITGTAIIGYLYMIERNWSGVKERIKNFFGREIIDRFN